MRARAAAVITLLAAVASACELDFVDPSSIDAVPELEGTVFVGVTDTARVDLDLYLDPAGLRRLLSDTVRVLDRALTPSDENGLGFPVYRTNWTDDDLAALPVLIDVVPPAIEGGATPERRSVGYTVVATGPDTIVVRRGRVAPLPIGRRPEADGFAPEDQQWTVNAIGADRRFELSTEGVVPDTVDLPTDWLPDGFEGDLRVEVTVHQSPKLEPAPNDVALAIHVFSRVAWTVRVQPPDATDNARGSP